MSESVSESAQARNFPHILVRLAANAVAAASVLAGKAAIMAGLRRAPEGWRRTVGILLRAESTRFALSAFGVRVPEGGSLEDRVARGLLAFLGQEPDAHFSLEWRPLVTLRRRTAFVDVVVLRFTTGGTLDGLRVWLSADGPAAPASTVQEQVHKAVIEAYNRTARLAEIERAGRLLAEVRARVPAENQPYAVRILSACCLSFDASDVSDRFSPPSFSERRTLGFGYLSWIARTLPGDEAVDLWVSAHHVGLDGVPLQDLLERLERAWGTAAPVVFPPAGSGTAFSGPRACHAPGERPVDLLTAFVDLSPVLALRRSLSARYAARAGRRSDARRAARLAPQPGA